MNKQFYELIKILEPAFQDLIKMPPVRGIHELPGPKDMPGKGIYLLSEDNTHLYVGRSNRLRKRLQQQTGPNSKENIAAFAFRLAREQTGRTVPAYKQKGSRSDLEADPEFQQSFCKAKSRIRNMDIRFIEENDPLRQALLEIYVSVCLNTPYNKFDTT